VVLGGGGEWCEKMSQRKGGYRELYNYKNILCGVFRAHVNVFCSKKCQTFLERLRKDGE
jgi:hypothetical protein